MTSFNLSYFLKTLSPDRITWELGLHHMNWGGSEGDKFSMLYVS